MMIPAGYLLKWTTPPPGWPQPNPSNIAEVCSVSDCVNENVVDLLESWKFNQFGLANSIETLLDLAHGAKTNLSKASLFFYSVYEYELESDGWDFDPDGWRALALAESSQIKNDVVPPVANNSPKLLGSDVVTFGDFPDHSPLSCNSVGRHVPVNEYCLFDDFSTAKAAIDVGEFGGGCEEGLYRIFSVNRLGGWRN